MLHVGESLLERLPDADAGTTENPAAAGSKIPDRRHTSDQGHRLKARHVYFDLLQDSPDTLAITRSRYYLIAQLNNVAPCATDLPEDSGQLRSWSDANTAKVGEQYREYLKGRRQGDPRRYFPGKSHALHFLKAVAPTKLVDGAWLYGLLERWHEPRFLPLIQTYLEELGEGVPDKNHVVIYKKLLAAHGCQQWTSLPDGHFVQGAIQLALARHASSFLPEVIGYNLGYEQLPLHLLISAYELNELGIDPYYFTLHVTVDNAATGHATQAVQGVFDALPHVSDKADFYRRVVNGYKLNSLGASTNSIISGFDLDAELLAILSEKSAVGAQLHSDYCKIAGKSVNEWLSDPAQLPLFLDSLQQNGWIRRNQTPGNSRFWKLIEGEQAQMFGVFNAYEKQVIHDWIAGDSMAQAGAHRPSFRAKQRLMNAAIPDGPASQSSRSSQDVGTGGAACPTYIDNASPRHNDFDTDVRLLEQELAGTPDRNEAIALLIDLMSPVHHHTGAGLMATRIFARWVQST